MKTFLTLLFLISLGFVYAQEKHETKKDSLVWTTRTCEKGVEDAKIDAEKGSL